MEMQNSVSQECELPVFTMHTSIELLSIPPASESGYIKVSSSGRLPTVMLAQEIPVLHR